MDGDGNICVSTVYVMNHQSASENRTLCQYCVLK